MDPEIDTTPPCNIKFLANEFPPISDSRYPEVIKSFNTDFPPVPPSPRVKSTALATLTKGVFDI